ncbi:MAG: tail protein X [Oscillospiraceae bacterium]
MSKIYTTVQGDMWDLVAYKELGDTKYTNLLINANLEHREYFAFPAGIKLTIPDVINQVILAEPPWKRVSG